MERGGDGVSGCRSGDVCPVTPALPHCVTAIVLAAGESSRFGAFKPLLPWPDAGSAETLTAYQVRQLQAAGCRTIIVVTGNRSAEVAAAARRDGVRIVENPVYREGKSSSVRAGVAAAPAAAPLLIVGVDQPRPAWFYHLLMQNGLDGAGLVIPTHAGRRGHPPLFAACLRDELLAVQEETFGLRAVVQRHTAAIRHLEVASPLTLVNLNTPDDLVAARELFAHHGDGR